MADENSPPPAENDDASKAETIRITLPPKQEQPVAKRETVRINLPGRPVPSSGVAPKRRPPKLRLELRQRMHRRRLPRPDCQRYPRLPPCPLRRVHLGRPALLPLLALPLKPRCARGSAPPAGSAQCSFPSRSSGETAGEHAAEASRSRFAAYHAAEAGDRRWSGSRGRPKGGSQKRDRTNPRSRLKARPKQGSRRQR